MNQRNTSSLTVLRCESDISVAKNDGGTVSVKLSGSDDALTAKFTGAAAEATGFDAVLAGSSLTIKPKTEISRDRPVPGPTRAADNDAGPRRIELTLAGPSYCERVIRILGEVDPPSMLFEASLHGNSALS